MPGQPAPEGADDRTVLYALPEDQPDSLSEGHTSNQADLDETPAQKAGTPDNGSKGEDPIVTSEGPVESGQSSSDDKPAKSATKGDWEAYAASRGIDTDGMTKDEILDAVG